MEKSTLITFLQKIGSRIIGKHESIKYYLFGSSLTNTRSIDIDLLIVYDEKNIHIAEALSLKRKLQSDFMREFDKRLDIVLFSKIEDKGNNFRHREKAIYIYG